MWTKQNDKSQSDYRHVRTLTATGRRFAVIGGGFVGSEIAAALAMNGKEVVMIFPDQDVGKRVFPRDLSRYVSSFCKQKGRGVLSWNVWGQVQAAHELIAESGSFTPKDLEGLLPVRSSVVRGMVEN
jgi:NADPH-dependent glutamate synthase beta subunit-like oxidoreductase